MININVIKGLKEIYTKYDTFILDQWGVMHDGYSGFKLAIECISELKSKNKNLLIVSNSSKKAGYLQCEKRSKKQLLPPDLWLMFAPLKKSRSELVVENRIKEILLYYL